MFSFGRTGPSIGGGRRGRWGEVSAFNPFCLLIFLRYPQIFRLRTGDRDTFLLPKREVLEPLQSPPCSWLPIPVLGLRWWASSILQVASRERPSVGTINEPCILGCYSHKTVPVSPADLLEACSLEIMSFIRREFNPAASCLHVWGHI